MSDLISRQAILDRTVNRNSIWNTITDSEGNNLEDILDSIPSIEKKGEWIPVSEKLPEIHQDVLLSLRSLDVVVGFRAKTEPYFYCSCVDAFYIEPQNVLAWQPLLEPYKVESED